MIFPILTLLTALALATVAGWFSIIGFMTIFAGATTYALAMGIVTEAAKLVTTSWLYRNWEHSTWRLNLPLILFTVVLMVITSMGVFGFLSKAHIEQNSSFIDNTARIEQLQFQIDREKSRIADNEKVITQLDATVNSFLGKENADKALVVRRNQATQRKQLRADIAESQKIIDDLNKQKFALESELRKVELEVGPIKYIGELLFGKQENTKENVERAVKVFILLLVIVLDPLAIVLLVAANHTILRLSREKLQKKKEEIPQETTFEKKTEDIQPPIKVEEPAVQPPVVEEKVEQTPTPVQQIPVENTKTAKKEETAEIYAEIKKSLSGFSKPATITQPEIIKIVSEILPNEVEEKPIKYTTVQSAENTAKVGESENSDEDPIIREIIGNNRHFIPKKVKESENKSNKSEN